MPRKCAVCAADSLTREQIEGRLRAGDSQAEIALDTNFSQDQIQRHAQKHVGTVNRNPRALVTELWKKLESLYEASAATGDVRAGVDVAGKLVTLLERLSALDAEKESTSNFENLTRAQQLDWIMQHNFAMGVFDRVNADCVAMGRELGPNHCPNCLRPYETGAPETQN